MKARLARIRIAKASSGAAFVSKKKAAEARLAAQESGLQLDDNYKEEDIFELQHHHLLRCLEKTTDREFVEMEVPYNGAPKRPGSPSPLTSPAHSTASRGGLLHACCGRCYPQRYQVGDTRITLEVQHTLGTNLASRDTSSETDSRKMLSLLRTS
ncbi:potassium voltage-gated channel protein Shal-like isoform X4 [Apis florea]|uniref:potassium voltage-gated channel protein Shal-like isoform X4 n=1 Tax=Apis florea TaxID=7463 RepID=UPI0012FEB392|nr:potassium voltage-gated channel protein Shal-like isoform X4 [Apis florea]